VRSQDRVAAPHHHPSNDADPIDQDDREGWITKDVCDDSAQNGRCRQTSECKHMLLIFWNAEQLGMNGRRGLVRQQNHKKKLPVYSYFKSINCSPHSLSENSGLVCLVWSQSDYEPVLTSFFFLFVGPFFLKRRFCNFASVFFLSCFFRNPGNHKVQ
jgi:hypothetical protein